MHQDFASLQLDIFKGYLLCFVYFLLFAFSPFVFFIFISFAVFYWYIELLDSLCSCSVIYLRYTLLKSM